MHKPNKRDFHTDCGLHHAWADYAKYHAKPTLSCKATFGDNGDSITEVFERATKDVSYKCHDGETYEQAVDVGKFDARYLIPYGENDIVSAATIKRLFREFMTKSCIVDVKFEFELVQPGEEK